MEFIGTAAQLSRASHFVPEQRSKKEVMLKHALGIVDTGNDSHSTYGNDNLSIYINLMEMTCAPKLSPLFFVQNLRVSGFGFGRFGEPVGPIRRPCREPCFSGLLAA